MDHLAQRNGSDYYHQSQPELMHNMNVLHNRSSVNIISNGGTGYTAISSSTSNVTSQPRPNTEEWKKSSGDRKSSIVKMESWKMSGRPRHAQLQHVQDDSRNRRQSAPLFNSPYQQQQQQHYPKPLPQEPSPVIHAEPFNMVYPPHISDEQPPFHLTTPALQHIPSYTHNEIYPAPLNQAYPPHPPPTSDFVPPPLVDYQHYHHPHPLPLPSQPYNEYPPSQPYNEYPPSQSYNEYPSSQSYNEYPASQYPASQPYNDYPPSQPFNEYPPVAPDHLNRTSTPIASPPSQAAVQEAPVPAPVPKSDKSSKKKKDAKPEKKIRQITVQSINIEHRVWIDVLPAETGLSLADKIHIIATFRTRKIVSITTASGRKIPLDNRPVFGSWMDMEKFEDGERWEVEWRENDRGVVDRFMSKIVQSKRKD